MKALILAAGFGTRLFPYTRIIPKPLFTLGSIPILQHTIQQLIGCGCRQILINTHHLSNQITAFLDTQKNRLDADIHVIHEPDILDTGGAIANIKQVVADQPFLVINGDVVTNIDLAAVWRSHINGNALATLVLHDRKKFNKVTMDHDNWICDFNAPGRGLAFTGIQVLSPEIFAHLPDQRVFSSIDLYTRLCRDRQVKAYVASDIFWEDIGTPDSYSRTARQWISADLLGTDLHSTDVYPLAEDGSDRSWYRAGPKSTPSTKNRSRSVVICDHGICLPDSDTRAQMDAFVHIGDHLFRRGIPVPRILAHDALAGMVALEDLGDTHLADWVHQTRDSAKITRMYQDVILQMILFSRKGAEEFNLSWTCQTPFYSKELILEKECRYFMDAFVRGYLKKDLFFDTFEDAFCVVAENALKGSLQGLMHRDCQSRNIMVRNGACYFIDFQSARLGPFQYDLASLLLDPYVTLPQQVQQDLLAYAMDRLDLVSCDSRQVFAHSYYFCCLTRNMQMLGAFAHLSQDKKKPWFETHIPAAVASLKHLMHHMESAAVVRLKKLIMSL
jgi:aminoglycoside/choline kinase family phosphotransferase/dTDP-glucose pyrophosphorylase